jgi:hypothetical protein
MLDQGGANIAWNPSWIGPHEGGLTLAMKFAWANALDGRAASRAISGKSLLQNYSPKLHGRSFLIPDWAHVAIMGRQPTIGALIAKRNLGRYAGRLAQLIGADHTFRYCSVCIKFGYQSLLFQLDAMKLCPMHRTPLLTVCTHCSAITPRFALTAEGLDVPFCCPACGQPYGDRFDPTLWSCRSLHEEVTHACKPILRFLWQAKQSNVEWFRWDDWLGPWLGLADQRRKRIATFDVLRRIVPNDLDETLFEAPAEPFMAAKSRALVMDPRQETLDQNGGEEYSTIYKSIRRYILKRLPKRVDRRLLLRPYLTEIDSPNDVLRLSLGQCPYVQTVWLWRLRMEQDVISLHVWHRTTLLLKDEVCNWPWKGAGDQSLWAYYVLAGFHAAAEVVTDWRERAVQVHSDIGSGTDDAQLITLHSQFAHLLSTSKLPLLPSISAVFVKSGKHILRPEVYVVGPQSGWARLAHSAVATRPAPERSDDEDARLNA